MNSNTGAPARVTPLGTPSHDSSIAGSAPMEVVAVLASTQHVDQIETIFDESGVPTWICLPACQARRMRFLQNVPGRHLDNPCLFLAFAPPDAIHRASARVAKASAEGEICAECAVFDWGAHAAQHDAVALDPVCEQVVDCEHSPALNLDGETFHFCSPACLETFRLAPQQYLERRNLPCRVGQRELTTTS